METPAAPLTSSPPSLSGPSGPLAFDGRWLLSLMYAMLTDQRPKHRPDRAALQIAVEADDLAVVTRSWSRWTVPRPAWQRKVPEVWWGKVKPQLDAYADDIEADERHVVRRLVERWRKAWVLVRNHMDPPGVMWLAPKGWLDRVLVAQHGGHLGRVHLADGRPATMYSAERGQDGPPAA